MSLQRYISKESNIDTNDEYPGLIEMLTETAEDEVALNTTDDEISRIDDTVAALEDIKSHLAERSTITSSEQVMLQIMNRLSVSGTGLYNSKIISGLETFNTDRTAALEAVNESIKDGVKAMFTSVSNGFGLFANISMKIKQMFSGQRREIEELREKYIEMSRAGKKTTTDYTTKTFLMRCQKFSDFRQGVKFAQDGLKWHADYLGAMVSQMEATEKDYTKWELFKAMFSYNEETSKEYFNETIGFVKEIAKQTHATSTRTFTGEIWRITDPVFKSQTVITIPNPDKFKGSSLDEMKKAIYFFKVAKNINTQRNRLEVNTFTSIKLADIGILLDSAEEALLYSEKMYETLSVLNRRIEVGFNKLMNTIGWGALLTVGPIYAWFFFARFMKRMISVHNSMMRNMITANKTNALKLTSNIISEANSLIHHARWD